MLQLPAILLSILVVSILSAGFYFWAGRTLKQLLLYWVASLAGFLLGQVLASLLGSSLVMIGQIHLVEGILLAFCAMFIVRLIKI